MISVTVNGSVREVQSAPRTRLLDVLRHELGLTGTKEGCGEGECGSCTVLLDGAPVNACLVAAGQVAGRAVVTVEGLGTQEHLGPLGQCFIEHGGAQCGICTPGMIVAAHALLRDNQSPTDPQIREALAGNLCRCTGYQRIVNSVQQAAALWRASPPPAMPTVPTPASGSGQGEGFARPTSLSQALALLSEHARHGTRPVLLAGGTDSIVDEHLAPRVHPATPRPPVVDLTAITDLTAIEEDLREGVPHFRLGALASYADLRRHQGLLRHVPMLAAMAREVGAVQIQERGTLGGNLATGSPAADGVPVLFALGATVLLASAAGQRAVPIESFYTGYRKNVMTPDEMIVAVEFAAPGPLWFWRKVGTRMAQSISKVALAATAQVEGGRITASHLGMASVAPTVAALPLVREELRGKAPSALDTERLHAALREDIAPIDDVRSTRDYRMHVAERLLDLFIGRLRG